MTASGRPKSLRRNSSGGVGARPASGHGGDVAVWLGSREAPFESVARAKWEAANSWGVAAFNMRLDGPVLGTLTAEAKQSLRDIETRFVQQKRNTPTRRARRRIGGFRGTGPARRSQPSSWPRSSRGHNWKNTSCGIRKWRRIFGASIKVLKSPGGIPKYFSLRDAVEQQLPLRRWNGPGQRPAPGGFGKRREREAGARHGPLSVAAVFQRSDLPAGTSVRTTERGASGCRMAHLPNQPGGGFGTAHRSDARLSAEERARPCPALSQQRNPCAGFGERPVRPLPPGAERRAGRLSATANEVSFKTALYGLEADGLRRPHWRAGKRHLSARSSCV